MYKCTKDKFLTEKRIHLLCVGWRNFFSSCAFLSIFGSGGKQVLVYILMNLQYLTVVVLCQFFWFWQEKVFGTYVLHTVVVLCQLFWFWQDIVFGVTYVLSVQYSCAVVFLKNDYLFSLFQRNNSLANICFLYNLNFLLLRITFLFSINQHLYSHNRFSNYIKTYLCMQKLVNNCSILEKKQPWNCDTFSKIMRPFPTFQLQSFLKNIQNFLCKQKIVNNCSIPSMHAIRKITSLSD